MIGHINNLEQAESVRAKLNAAIDAANEVSGKAPASGQNYRFADGKIQFYEHVPTPGWRTAWLENGAWQFGELEAD